jgi:hypothetical protein
MTPLVSSQRIRSQRGLIRRIGPTAAANPAHSGQTLLRCCEPAIRGPSPREIVIGTPRIVLRRSRFFKATESGKHTNDEQRIPHGNLLVIPVTKSGQWLISQVEPAESVDAARGSRALVKCCEAAVCNPTNYSIAINCAPSIIWALARVPNSDDVDTNDPEHELQEPHNASEISVLKLQMPIEDTLFPHSR